MPYTLRHVLVDHPLRLRIDSDGDTAVVRCSDSGNFRLRYPGPLSRGATAQYTLRVRNVTPGPEPDLPRPRAGPFRTQTLTLPLTLKIFAPDGREFTGTQVTLADLARYRDARGVTQGSWRYSLVGQSQTHVIGDGVEIRPGNGRIGISVVETVHSKSAPPLVNGLVGNTGEQRFAFDLFRIGQLKATIRSVLPFGARRWRGTMQLLDPAGRLMVQASSGHLELAVTPALLDRSRGPGGQVLLWTLVVRTQANGAGGSRLSATVQASARLRTATLQERIDTLLGPGGNKLRLFGENKGGRAMLRLRIEDELSAETIDMHGLLDAAIRGNTQDAGVDTVHADVRTGQTYTLAQTSERMDYGLRLIVNQVRLKKLTVTVGASKRIQPAVPALRIVVETVGDILVRVGGFTLANAKLRGNRLELELGLRLDEHGSVVPVMWMDDDFLDVDVHWTAAIAAGVVSFGLLTLGAAGVAEYMEETRSDEIREKITKAVAGIAARIPQMLAVLMGDDFTYTGLRLDGQDIVFDHVAPLEPDPRPSPIYRGVLGRTATQLGPDAWSFQPQRVGDTWAAQNLAKVDHVVVVMMENRSFDHVLGYRGQLPGANGGDGLSAELLQTLQQAGFTLPPLGRSTLQVKTQFPVAVGHELHDVAEQLAHRLPGPGGRTLLSPQGFVSNFKTRHDKLSAQDKARVQLHDVLGWYDGADLAFFRYLAEHYAYSDRYFCAHPGPTLPNRMFSLTGDVQYDRAGEAIVDNNDGDDFYLSRAFSIYDLFNRKGLDWRVYESFPSVTMLRMFARYATDDRQIVPIDRLAQDVAAGNLPPLTVIEPAMHHFPQNDDHPVADMRNGQAFLKGVYDTLRSNPGLWAKTLLVITYDEHGGFYDHMVPPIADLRDVRQVGTVASGGLGGSAMASTVPLSRAAASEALDAGLRAGLVASSGALSASLGLSPATKQDRLTPYGVRVPLFLVSPWVQPGRGPDLVLDHCSILKTLLARFVGPDAPFLSDRVAASRSFEAFLAAPQPRLEVPPAPAIQPVQRGMRKIGRSIVTAPMSRAAMRRGNVDYHDLTGWLARQLGR
jgi:phospholipase C